MHQYYKKVSQSWFRALLARLGRAMSPVGTIGPIDYITCAAGPNRKQRRASQAKWRRYGDAAIKIAKRRGIKIDEALTIAMAT